MFCKAQRHGPVMRIFVNRQHHAHDVQSELHEGTMRRSFECPERLDIITSALSADGHQFVEPSADCPTAILRAVHSADYLEFLETAWAQWSAEHPNTSDALGFTWPVPGLRRRSTPPKHIDALMGYYSFCVDTGVNAGTWRASMMGAACAHAAAGAAMDQGKAFALTRPPGHHAHADMYGGYCFVNNAAVAVESFRVLGAKRVAVLDVDYHHGNGTQAIYYDRDDVLTISLHADPDVEFPYFLGFADEAGEGLGLGKNLNLPMPFGTDYAAWSQKLDQALKAIEAHGTDALVVPLGVDTHYTDPISQFRLETDDFARMGQAIARLKLPTVVTMEGGYATQALGDNVARFFQGFLSSA